MKEPIFNLTPEEQEIEDAFERGEYVSMPILAEEKTRLAAIARNTLAKNRVITIRVTERNFNHIKAVAAREGLPYQTLITSVLHKHVKL
jgi:predicted DNA binding CopG/RHH family protein